MLRYRALRFIVESGIRLDAASGHPARGVTSGSCWAKSPAPSSPLCHWRAWFTSGTLARGRWLSRHGAGCLSCQVTSTWLDLAG